MLLRSRPYLPLLAALAGYAGSRIFYSDLGLELDMSPLPYFWQYQDVEQLRTNLWEALFYQHTQPPLFNLYLGAGLKTSDPRAFFQVGAVCFGLVLHLGIFALARCLSIRPWLASASAITFAFNPASILMETWLFYACPVAALVILGAVLLHRGLRPGGGWMLFGALLTVAAVVLTRSLFHIAWMVVVVAVALLLSRRRRRVLAIAIIPVVLASSIYLKNWIVFGRPVASTWMGFSLSRMTTTRLSESERRTLMRAGILSDLGNHLPWWPLHRYPAEYRNLPESLPAVPVLTQPSRSTGHLNLNHGAYLVISRRFERDARAAFEHAPEVWWASTQEAWRVHFLPIHDYGFFYDRRRAAGPWMRRIEQAYELMAGSFVSAEWSWDEPMPPLSQRPGWAWPVATAIALLFATAVAIRRRRGGATTATLVYCVFTIVFVSVVGNSLELGENQRFRFLSEPLTWVLITFVIDRGGRALRSAGARGWDPRRAAAGHAPKDSPPRRAHFQNLGASLRTRLRGQSGRRTKRPRR